MKIVVLTTDTSHHNYIVREIDKLFCISHVLEETTSLQPSFDTYHSYVKKQDAYEWELFFDGKKTALRTLAETSSYPSINSHEAVLKLRELSPDIVITIGTGKLSKEVIKCCPDGFINLHGGDPEEYRGLDSHLWAIYHRDYDALMATLHMLTPDLDAGDILYREKIGLLPRLPFYKLRAENVKVCVRLLCRALSEYQEKKEFSHYPQMRKGRYYSFMPAPLKKICVARFERYTATFI